VPQDNVEAYVWFSLAVKNGLASAARKRDTIAARLSPVELKEAEHLLAERAESNRD
jgi:TPR repeat protein